MVRSEGFSSAHTGAFLPMDSVFSVAWTRNFLAWTMETSLSGALQLELLRRTLNQVPILEEVQVLVEIS